MKLSSAAGNEARVRAFSKRGETPYSIEDSMVTPTFGQRALHLYPRTSKRGKREIDSCSQIPIHARNEQNRVKRIDPRDPRDRSNETAITYKGSAKSTYTFHVRNTAKIECKQRREHFSSTFELRLKNRCDPYESGVRGRARINNKIIEMEIFVNGWKFAPW